MRSTGGLSGGLRQGGWGFGVRLGSGFGPRSGSGRRLGLAGAWLGAAMLLAGCYPSSQRNDQDSDARLREQAAQATQNVKAGSKIVAADAKVAAAEAGRKAKDIAAGIKDGLHSPTPGTSGDRIDLNSATEGQLASLPGISDARARRIIAHRPYSDPHELVRRGILTPAEYKRLEPELTAQ